MQGVRGRRERVLRPVTHAGNTFVLRETQQVRQSRYKKSTLSEYRVHQRMTGPTAPPPAPGVRSRAIAECLGGRRKNIQIIFCLQMRTIEVV